MGVFDARYAWVYAAVASSPSSVSKILSIMSLTRIIPILPFLLIILQALYVDAKRQPTSAVFTGLIQTASNSAVEILLPTVLPKKKGESRTALKKKGLLFKLLPGSGVSNITG